jgi:hypothetical protein
MAFLLSLITFAIVFITISVISAEDKYTDCTVSAPGVLLSFPKDQRSQYEIVFHADSIKMVPIYAKYVVPFEEDVVGSRGRCTHMDLDPYGVDSLHYEDYTSLIGADRVEIGQLVPSLDYGNGTCYMPNAIPIRPNFYLGPWSYYERFIHKNFVGYTVYKGCDYSEKWGVSRRGSRIFYPTGCYYVVMDRNTIKANGYVENNEIQAQKSQDRLPHWVTCASSNSLTQTEGDIVSGIVSTIISTILMSCISGAILTGYLIVRRFLKLRRERLEAASDCDDFNLRAMKKSKELQSEDLEDQEQRN